MKKPFHIIALIFAITLFIPVTTSFSFQGEIEDIDYMEKSQKLMPYLQNIQRHNLTSPVKFSSDKNELKQLKKTLFVKSYLIEKTKTLD